MKTTILHYLGAFLLLAPLSVTAQDSADFSPQALASPPETAWPTNGGNLYNQRWSPLDEINQSNIDQLKGVWRTHLDGSGMGTRYSGEAQPIVYDGVIYTITGDNDVFAVSVDNGEILWRYTTEFEPGMNGEHVCCGWTNRGVAINEDLVFFGRLDARLIALDRQTGEPVWEATERSWQEGYSITSAPLYYDGLVITGYAGAERGIRGVVDAFDAKTGELAWSFYTIPGPGELGHDTWPADNNVWEFGGGSVWQTPAVDPELGLLYFSTGNPGPDFNGFIREGDNLFTASIVAVDVHSGEYRWHFQQVHHDIWDYDAPNPIILFDIDYQGEDRQALASAGKTGWVYILDRVTGEPLIGIVETAVPQEPLQKTAATQPYPIGDSFIPQFVDMAPEGINLVNQGRIFTPFTYENPALVQPGPAGAANWPPSAIDPTRNVMYVCAGENSFLLEGGGPDLEVPEDKTGASFVGGGFTGTRPPSTGVIAAMDLSTNTLVWQYRWPDNSCFSGFLSTAGDLLFIGRNDGRLTALDTDTGMLLWEFQTGAGMNAPVSTFEYEGTQYLAAYSAGNLFAGSEHGDSLWLFALDGKLGPATAGDSAAGLSQAPVEVVAPVGEADLAAGENIYRQSCLPCHGEDGLGGHGGGAPLSMVDDINAAMTIIGIGRNDMPAFAGALSAEQIRDVSSYIMEGLFTE